jgi:hypothetical protein
MTEVIDKIRTETDALAKEFFGDGTTPPVQSNDNQLTTVDDQTGVTPAVSSVSDDETQQTIEPSQDTTENWETKYKTLQGKYNAEVPRLNQEVKGLRDESAKLKAKVELFEQLVAQQVAQQPVQKQDTEELEPEIKQLQEDFPEIYKAVMKVVEKHGVSKQDLQNVNQQVQNAQMSSFYSRLAQKVPDWETLNTDKDFLTWLQEPADFTNKTKQQLLQDAAYAGNVDLVAKFFLTYKNQNSTSAADESKFSNMVAPPKGRSPTAVTSNSASKPIFTAQQVEQFYRDKSLGRLSKEKANQMEEAILAAAKDKRIKF